MTSLAYIPTNHEMNRLDGRVSTKEQLLPTKFVGGVAAAVSVAPYIHIRPYDERMLDLEEDNLVWIKAHRPR